MASRLSAAVTALLCLSFTLSCWGEVKLGEDAKEGMTLTRRKQCVISGRAKYKEKVTVTFRGRSASTVCNNQGDWTIAFDGGEPGGPFPLVVEGSNRIELKEVFVPDVVMSEAYSEGMVLQQGKSTRIRGWAVSGKEVKVTFRGKSFSARTEDGEWRMEIDTGDAGGPFPLTVESVMKKEIKEVYVGDVWLVSGQSNSQSTFFSKPPPAPPESGDRVRFFWSRKTGNRWFFKDGPMSMFAWYFGHGLYRERKVPLGLIVASTGGITLEQLTPPAARKKPIRNGAYELYVEAVCGYPIKGAIFWQGESDLPAADEYAAKFPEFIGIWRREWGQGDFPFLYVQLERLTPKSSVWFPKPVEQGMLPVIWDAQRRALSVPNTAMVSAFDVSGAVHPGAKGKEIICGRMVRAALATVYGREGVEWTGPLLDKAELRGDDVVLSFTHAEGLAARAVIRDKGETWTAKQPEPDGKARGLEIQASGGEFTPVAARIDGRTVVIPAKGLARPLRVRYAWKYTPDGNLYNSSDLPASPFQTDLLSEKTNGQAEEKAEDRRTDS